MPQLPQRLRVRHATELVCAALALICSGSTLAQSTEAKARGAAICGSLQNNNGPYEYRPDHYRPAPLDRVPQSEKLRIVETNHFSAGVAALVKGQTARHPGVDLDFMLREFPNHHRGLAALLKVARGGLNIAMVGLPLPAECYFDRALRFAPNDTVARLLYAQFLILRSRTEEANAEIDSAVSYAEESLLTHYNCGLMYFEAKNFEAALRQAHYVYARGFEATPLEKQLRAVGQWREAATDSAKPTN